MMSIRSLADFNRSSRAVAVTGWHRHRHRPGPELPADTANEGWGLLTGHQRGPRPGHTRGLSHGHGHDVSPRNPARPPEGCTRVPPAAAPRTPRVQAAGRTGEKEARSIGFSECAWLPGGESRLRTDPRPQARR